MIDNANKFSMPVRSSKAHRKAISVSQTKMVTDRPFSDDHDYCVIVEPAVRELDACSWAMANREWVDRLLVEKGAILFRGFSINSADNFRHFALANSENLLNYTERAAPRKEIASEVYTSTEFPADQTIPLHHEMSYASSWPWKIWFFCNEQADEGGCTPIASEREVTSKINPKIKQRFIDKQILYVRNYGEGVDLPWQEAFQTTDKSKVEAYCSRFGMTCEWRGGERLRTSAKRQVMITHPQTAEKLWFNHMHMFHMSNLPSLVQESLLSQFEPNEFPRNAFYGDGSMIEEDVIEEIRSVYDDNILRFEWQQGDILMLDNFLSVHGRDPFKGSRQVLVAMADLYGDPDPQNGQAIIEQPIINDNQQSI